MDVFDLQGHGPKAAPMSEVVSEFYTEQPCITPEERVDRFKTTHKFIQESLPVDKFFSKKTQVISLRVFQEKGGPTKTMEVLQAGDGYLFYLERNAEGNHTTEDIKRIFALQFGVCIACPADLVQTGYHVDHRIALINSGSNDYRNLDLLCPSCNCSKADKHPIDFMQSRGFLL